MWRWWGLATVVSMAGLGAFITLPGNAIGSGSVRTLNDPMALYGRELKFDVLRNGEESGWHIVRFGQNGSEVTVSSTFHLQIDVLFLSVFRYRYHSQATWSDGQLDRLMAQVDDDGELLAIEVTREGNRLTVRNGRDVYDVDAPLYPTNHWNVGVLGQTRVLNTLTGRVNRVGIRPVARETVATERGDVTATRYAYTGELETEVWYDDARRWVKMRFAGRDGSIIEYVCRLCQGGPVRKAQN